MLQQLEVVFAEPYRGFSTYYVFYDDEHMTQEQAEKELEFMDWGGGYNKDLYPYYLIVPDKKKPLLSSIKKFFTESENKQEYL